jgi:hypothetical protein
MSSIPAGADLDAASPGTLPGDPAASLPARGADRTAPALLALRLYGRRAVLLSATIPAAPVLVDYRPRAATAGWLSPSCLLLAVYLKERPNLAAWGLLRPGGGAGSVHSPGLYPLGMVYSGCSLGAVQDTAGEYQEVCDIPGPGGVASALLAICFICHCSSPRARWRWW